jgi:hypothetical protein
MPWPRTWPLPACLDDGGLFAAQRSKRGSDLICKQLGLLERGKMTALIELVEMHQFSKPPLGPSFR